jgi:predicted GH43/DUF377 family glycosyl hydrolase
VLYPDNGPWKKYEWVGGCEDIHIVEDEVGAYYANYTAWNGKTDSMCVATSNDLIHWQKHGPAFKKAYGGKFVSGSRTGTVVCRREEDRLIATKINGKYWMYWRIGCFLATSDNLIDWTPLIDKNGQLISAIIPRKGFFDSSCCEAGAIAFLTDRGILFMYNGANLPHNKGGDPTLPGSAWPGLGQALFDVNDPTRSIARLDNPFIHAEYDWELKGFTNAAVVANGLVYFKGEWLLYYGAADRRIALAVYKA